MSDRLPDSPPPASDLKAAGSAPEGGAEDAPKALDLEALEEELEVSRREAAEARDAARRAQADLANVRRRASEERSTLRSRALEDVCRGLLPVLDDLERAAGEVLRAAAVEGEQQTSGARPLTALGDGVRLVLRRFEETLSRQGLEEIEALGAPFDPRLHEALQQVDAAPGQRDGDVVTVFRRGYLLDGRVIRPAQVIVATGEPASDEEVADDGDAAPDRAGREDEGQPEPLSV